MIGAIVVEFGCRGALTDEVIQGMKNAVAMAAAVYPGKPIGVTIGGYDDDPRDLWEIPEVADYVRRYAKAAGLYNWRGVLFGRLMGECKALLVKCDAIEPGHPFKVTP